MQQPNSKTQQLITRTNYLKHKQKLTEIKNNTHNTSMQFYSSGKAKPVDRKRMLMLKLKRDEIEAENEQLRRKIQRINHSTTNQNWRRRIVSENGNRKASYSFAYNPDSEQKQKERGDNTKTGKMEINSQSVDGDNIKCFLPANKNRVKFVSISQSKANDYNAIIFNLREKQKASESKNAYLEKSRHSRRYNNDQQQQLQTQQKNPNKQTPDISKQHPQPHPQPRTPSITILDQNPKLKHLIRQSTTLTRNELLYNEPEKEAHRIVVYKKTKIPYPMVSFLVEISLIDNRLLIAAYGMGLVERDFRCLVSRRRTRRILEEIKGRYEVLWERVEVDVEAGIRLSQFAESDQEGLGDGDPYQQPGQRQKTSQQRRYQITQDFLQRNYYTLLKQSTTQKTKQKQQILPQTHQNPKQNNRTSPQKYKYQQKYQQKQKQKVQKIQRTSSKDIALQNISLSREKIKNKSILRAKIQFIKERAGLEREAMGSLEKVSDQESLQDQDKVTDKHQKLNQLPHKNRAKFNTKQKHQPTQKQPTKPTTSHQKLKQDKPNPTNITNKTNTNNRAASKIQKQKQKQTQAQVQRQRVKSRQEIKGIGDKQVNNEQGRKNNDNRNKNNSAANINSNNNTNTNTNNNSNSNTNIPRNKTTNTNPNLTNPSKIPTNNPKPPLNKHPQKSNPQLPKQPSKQSQQQPQQQQQQQYQYQQQYQQQFDQNPSNLTSNPPNKSAHNPNNPTKKSNPNQKSSYNISQQYFLNEDIQQVDNASKFTRTNKNNKQSKEFMPVDVPDQEYSMEFDGSGGNNSSVRAVKKKTINQKEKEKGSKNQIMDKSVNVDEQYQQYIEDLEYADSFEDSAIPAVKKGKNQPNKANPTKPVPTNPKNHPKAKPEIQQQYIDQFQS